MLLEVLRETVIDSLKLLPFLFAAYLAIEFIEDRAEEKTVALVHRAGRWGPVLGAALGVIPQCGFSAATANLYAGGIITRGTLLAVFLSTSDEMLPILLSSSAPVSLILKLLGYKALAGILLGVTVDTVASKLGYERKKSIHEMCEQEHCHCEDGIFKSALRHTLKIFAFLFVVTFVLNLLVEAVGPETLGAFVLNRPVIGERRTLARTRHAARRHHRLHPELRGQRCPHDALSRRRDVRRRDALGPSCRLGRGASRAAAHEPRLAR